MYKLRDIWYDVSMRRRMIDSIRIFIAAIILLAAGFPCEASSSASSAIHSVAISPGSTVVTKNSTFTFTASVTGENDYSSEVVWSVSGQTSQSTFIDSKGVLNVAADEGASSLVVKAVSRQDSAYSATALATVQNATYRVNISVNDGNGGTATEGKTVNAGESMTVKATPKDGWRFVEWRENDKNISNNQEFTLENITGDRNLTAVFEKEPPKTYTVAAAVATTGGIITPTGASPVPAGSWIGYAITPDRGYRVRMVYVDGEAIGAATSYNFTDVQKDHTISAEFEPDPAQAQTNQNQTGQTLVDDPEKSRANKTDQEKENQNKADAEKPKQSTSGETDSETDKKSDKDAAQKEKDAAAKAEREQMEQERMEQEKADAEREQRIELEKEKTAREKAEAEKAEAEQKAAKARQQRIVFGIVAAVIAACALGVFLVVKKRRE